MKKCLHLLLMLTFILSGSIASAKDFEVNGIAYDVISMSELTCEVAQNNTYYENTKIPATVTYKGKTFKVLGVGDNAFKYSNIKDVTIAPGLTYIGEDAFAGCNFKHISIPNTITNIAQNGFYSCGWPEKGYYSYISIISELIIEDGADMLEGKASYGGSTFWGNLIKKLYLGRNINDAVLNDALHHSLEELTIGNMVTELKHSNLNPSDIFGLSKLRKLTIGTGLKKIPFLDEGDDLTEIYLRSTTPQISEGFNDGTYMHATLFVPKGTKVAYENADIWKNFWTIEEYEDKTTNISNIRIKPKSKTSYTMNGVKTNSAHRGITVINGKKYINK